MRWLDPRKNWRIASPALVAAEHPSIQTASVVKQVGQRIAS
jgi:hypothetical protein